MASIENVIMNDDLDPRISTGVETVQFHNPINGELMEIELGEANRKHFSNHLEKLAKYIAAARVVETKPARKATSGTKNDLTAVREWARANGFEVGDRGRIKAEILEAFDKAQMPESVKATLETAPVDAPEVSSEPVSEVEGTETQDEQAETPETGSELSDENQELMEFLKANMDKDGKVHAASLADAPTV